MADAIDINGNAARDAAAVVALLHRGNPGDLASAELLMRFYNRDQVAQAALCGALAAFATAVLSTIDTIADELRTVHGVDMPTSRDVLSSVLTRLACDG
jgi:hypothetical protein